MRSDEAATRQAAALGIASLHAVQVERLSYEIAGRRLLEAVNLTVAHGESVAVTGPSGSGKTTLLVCLAGLVRPDSGRVVIGGRDVTGLRASQLPAFRLRSIGFVYQFGELLPELTPTENVALPGLLLGWSRPRAYERARTLLDDLEVPFTDSRASSSLSGGERQRVSVARALVAQPQLLLADEPTGALDRTTGEAVSELLHALPRRYGCALITVTHNERLAARADRCLQLADGALTEATTSAP